MVDFSGRFTWIREFEMTTIFRWEIKNWYPVTMGLLILWLVCCLWGWMVPPAWSISLPKGLVKSNSLSKVVEVSPPQGLQKLSEALDMYRPQVSILSPKPDEVIQETTVKVTFQVEGLPLFQDKELELGPHLHVLVDNQPGMDVFDITQPLILKDLSPGTHILRVFAARPWQESFKNEGAYLQINFHVFTKTDENQPDPKLPLLTFNQPIGNLGAEPILLDYYLTNAPLHLVAQEHQNDTIGDWRIRATINNSSFILDHWQPLYLKGFNPGSNWVKLELIDDQGNGIRNGFNSVARLFTYKPNGQDGISKLTRGEISLDKARQIVDINRVDITPSSPVPSPSPEPSSVQVINAPSAEASEPSSSSTKENSGIPSPSTQIPSPVPMESEAPKPDHSETFPKLIPEETPPSPSIDDSNHTIDPTPITPTITSDSPKPLKRSPVTSRKPIAERNLP